MPCSSDIERVDIEPAQDSANFFKAIVEQTSEGIAVADKDGNYLYVNPAFCAMSGFSADELTKMTVFDVKATEQPPSSFVDAKFGPRRPTKSVPFRPVISVRWRPGKSDQSARPAA